MDNLINKMQLNAAKGSKHTYIGDAEYQARQEREKRAIARLKLRGIEDPRASNVLEYTGTKLYDKAREFDMHMAAELERMGIVSRALQDMGS